MPEIYWHSRRPVLDLCQSPLYTAAVLAPEETVVSYLCYRFFVFLVFHEVVAVCLVEL